MHFSLDSQRKASYKAGIETDDDAVSSRELTQPQRHVLAHDLACFPDADRITTAFCAPVANPRGKHYLTSSKIGFLEQLVVSEIADGYGTFSVELHCDRYGVPLLRTVYVKYINPEKNG